MVRGDTMESYYKSVITINEYGKINLHLKEVMDSKGITRNNLARASNTRFEVVNKWYNGTVERIDADILARFCFTLDCDVSDIIEYVK